MDVQFSGILHANEVHFSSALIECVRTAQLERTHLLSCTVQLQYKNDRMFRI